jgi:hypothetical protein
MAQIYMNATRILIWLANEDYSLALSLLVQIRVHVQEKASLDDLIAVMSSQPVYQATSELNEALGLPTFSDPSWHTLSRLYELPWFFRVWVKQELAVSREALVLVSDCAIDWATIGISPTWLMHKGFMRAYQFGYTSNTSSLHWERTVRRNITSRPCLVNFLFQPNTWQASGPRDKVYAILGLAAETMDLEKCPQLAPDYSKTLLDVYRDTAIHILHNHLAIKNKQDECVVHCATFSGACE